ncbi:MAG: SGNH/GDSL hydrolase family protein [Bacteroidales bacterium]|nr:SGNH/GDSL hydrolase family protein [Bacteroidales bacterium]
MKNPITVEELQALLNDESTVAEAMDFYFEYIPTGPFTGEYQLKSHIQIVKNYNYQTTGVVESASLFNIKEIILNDANSRARKSRDKIFSRRGSDGDRKILVTEGDSWFQYPKYKKMGLTLSKEVKDVIDYLIEEPDYNVKSLDAAGDMIRNMFHLSEYLEAIREHNPKAFILSGGGNDFFEVFPNMLTEGSADSMESYLKISWTTEIKVIETYYKGFLDILTEEFPALPVILHGYDYIMPRPDGKWIGKPMITKGKLNMDKDRKVLIKLVMDRFNQTLLDLSLLYENVHFIDLRNTVPQDASFWHDEIHPNDEGFKLVADKFIATLKSIGV